MAINLSKIKRSLNKQARAEDKALKNLQRYFESSTSRGLGFSSNITNEPQLIIDNRAYPIYGERRFSHDISWDDISNAYQRQEYIHTIISDVYKRMGKKYGGRQLYQQYDMNKFTTDAAGRTIIKGFGSTRIDPTSTKGYGGRYEKLDMNIQKAVLDYLYTSAYKETNKHLLDKFETVDLNLTSGSSDEFKKLIKVTNELITDIKKVKAWAKSVEKIVNSAKIQHRGLGVSPSLQVEKSPWLLTIEELTDIGKAILGRSTELCPIETGFLRSSGKVYVSSIDIRIIYECPYAAYVHDNPNAQHAVGTDHFLQKAAQEILPKIAVWTESTGNDSWVFGTNMQQTWEHDQAGNVSSDMFWTEQKGFRAIYLDIDRNLRVNFAHYK